MDRSDPTHNHHHRGSSNRNSRSSASSSSASHRSSTSATTGSSATGGAAATGTASSALFRGSHNRPWQTDPGVGPATSNRLGINIGGGPGGGAVDADFEDDLQQAPRFNRRSGAGNNYSPSPSPRASGSGSGGGGNSSLGGSGGEPGSSFYSRPYATSGGGNSYESPIALAAEEIRSSSPLTKSKSSPRLLSSSKSSALPSAPPVYGGSSSRNNASSLSSTVHTSAAVKNRSSSSSAQVSSPVGTSTTSSTFKTSMSTSSYERYRARLRQQEEQPPQQQQSSSAASSATTAPASKSSASTSSNSSSMTQRYQDHVVQKGSSSRNTGSKSSGSSSKGTSVSTSASRAAAAAASSPISPNAAARTAAGNEMAAAMATMKKAQQATLAQQQQQQQQHMAAPAAMTPATTSQSLSLANSSSPSSPSKTKSSKSSSSSSSKQTTGSSRDMRKSRLAAEKQERRDNSSSSNAESSTVATESSSNSSYEKRRSSSKSEPPINNSINQDRWSSSSSTPLANSSAPSAILSSSSRTAPAPPPAPTAQSSSSTRLSNSNNSRSGGSVNSSNSSNSSSAKHRETTPPQSHQPIDETLRTTDSAVRGWSTAAAASQSSRSSRRRREAESMSAINKTDHDNNNDHSVAEAEAAAAAAQAAAAQAAAMEASMIQGTESKSSSMAAAAAVVAAAAVPRNQQPQTMANNTMNSNATSGNSANVAAAPPLDPLPVVVGAGRASSVGSGGLGSSKVGAYLAARQRRNSSLRPLEAARPAAAVRASMPIAGDKEGTTPGAAPAPAPASSGTVSASSSARASFSSRASSSFDEESENVNGAASGGHLSTTDDDEDEDGISISSCSSGGSEIEGGNEPEWSVRVCVVSAVDFPPNVVPNVPFSPVLKVGVVHFPKNAVVGDPSTASKSEGGGKTTSVDLSLDAKARGLQTAIEASGLMAFPKARIRCTSSKVLSKRDNGSVEFHEEMRWDRVQNAHEAALVIELSARAVMTPSNIKESPVAQTAQSLLLPSPGNSVGRRSPMNRGERGGPGDPAAGRLGSLFRRGGRQKSSSEMETANAAAVVAKHLVEGEERKSSEDFNDEEGSGPLFDSKGANARMLAAGHQSEMDVKLRSKRRQKRPKMTEDIRLGSQIVPFTKLPLSKALKGKESARIEQWFELHTNAGGGGGGGAPPLSGAAPRSAKRNPSILLEISFSAPEILDESEDDMDEVDELPPGAELKASFSRRASIKIRNQLKQEITPEEPKPKEVEPVLEPGVLDYVCVVGARDIGDQKADDGSSGWVKTKPECCLLEQFPPSADMHASNGRNTPLPDKVEWFCFPEGCRLWRGTTPPNADELNLKRFSASSPANIATTIASFDAWLGCTTSFSWFVLASNSEEYGSAQNKTVGACIRFYVPAPIGIDPTQDDFAQTLMGVGPSEQEGVVKKRLWVPIGICLVSSIPIVGALEVMLLRLCEALATHGFSSKDSGRRLSDRVYGELRSLIVNYQRPIPGVVHCSIPFLDGDRLLIGLPPRAGLPPLPHGSSVTSVCRLLGADGMTFILSAMLTECKILLHSDDVANLCLVAEVMTALLYPFSWSLPYIPVLPAEMMEFIEAPLSYLLGVPSCNMLNMDPYVLEDVVVVDLDRDFSSGEFFEERSTGQRSKAPTPLPSSTANNISKAVYRLLHAEDDLDDGSGSFSSQRTFPRLEAETLQEREFRIAVALELCGLVRGYQECLAYASSSQPIFNVDKFLQSAPVLFDDQRGAANAVTLQGVSPRSRRFMSIFVNCQHFHQFIESIDTEAVSFFHEIMAELNAFGAKKDLLAVKRVLSLDAQKTIDQLSSSLQRMDDKIPVYHVTAIESGADGGKDCTARFPIDLLQSIVLSTDSQAAVGSSTEAEGVKHLSVEYLVELEKNPWRYQAVFTVDLEEEGNGSIPVAEKVKLREAIGERRYRAWKNSLEKGDGDDASVLSEDVSKSNLALDLSTLLSYNADDATTATSESGSVEETPEQSSQRRIADAKDRDVLRRCLERARVSGQSTAEPLMDNGRDLVSEAEAALRNPSARRFLLSVLSKRSHSESEGKDGSKGRRRSNLAGISKLEAGAFEVLVRLGCAMLDACMEDKDYDSTYSLLKLTAGLYCTIGEGDAASILYMTQRMGHHPIYADLGVWEKAKEMHLSARQEDNGKDDSGDIDEEYDEYEAAVATLYEMLGYGIPAEELARFASRVSEENGWFRSERGQSLLLLARRICIRRDQGEAQSSSKTSDIEMMSPATKGRTSHTTSKKDDKTDQSDVSHPSSSTPPPFEDVTLSWVEIGWAHPTAQSSRRGGVEKVRRATTPSIQSSTAEDHDPGQRSSNYMKRSAITSMAYLGSSVVVTGGLDGGVFMARKVSPQEQGSEEDTYSDPSGVRGVHLDWGSSGSRYAVGSASTSMDGEYGVGAVSCLAATRAANQSYHSLMSPRSPEKDVVGALDDEDLLDAMEGCRVVAGTTCGDLRVWSVKDVLSAVFFANRGGDLSASAQSEARTFHRGGEGASSTTLTGRRKSTTDFAAGSSLTRLKFSLRGRALSGHRGGVSCVDVPSNVYRPDSVISGGADGLIKLWSLRAPGSGRRGSEIDGALMTTKGAVDQLSPRTKAARSGDALSILSGHGGRILCVKTAWHGDRLLSGGADRTVRVWDLAGSGGKCLHSLSGHFGWVSSVQYWGPNTIISASTDRSIALWDARVRNSPLFTLRHHYASISDVLVGSRTDPIMISAASDGTIAAWDFRRLSDENSQSERSKHRMCKVVRRPAASLYLHDFSSRRHVCGPTLLSRGPSLNSKTVFCVGRDAVIREWNISTGEVVSEHATGHCDTISSFASFQGDQLYDTQLESTGSESVSGTITTSWDGTVRIRRLAR